MEIRRATPEDAEIVLAYFVKLQTEGLKTILRHENVPSLDEERQWLRNFSGEEGVAFLCVAEGQVVGMLNANRNKHPQLSHRCKFGMGVLGTHRNQGLGSRLMEAVILWARQKNLRRLELSVMENNRDAQRFYERHGFVVEGRKTGAVLVEGQLRDVIEMVKPL
jgi:RimJ/RimL family protein N-acetyltransferase